MLPTYNIYIGNSKKISIGPCKLSLKIKLSSDLVNMFYQYEIMSASIPSGRKRKWNFETISCFLELLLLFLWILKKILYWLFKSFDIGNLIFWDFQMKRYTKKHHHVPMVKICGEKSREKIKTDIKDKTDIHNMSITYGSPSPGRGKGPLYVLA